MDIAARLPRKVTSLFHARKQHENPDLFEELSDLQLQLDTARNQFEILTDEEMITACCYQMKALTTRYNKLLREARASGLSRNPY